MENRVTSHPLEGVSRLVWRPVLRVTGWLRRVQQATERLSCQLREVATLLRRVLDAVVLQATQLRARSQVELVFGALTVSVSSGVLYARPDTEVVDVAWSR